METPCPDKILDDCGGAYAMGLVGGGVWHMFKGMKNSPRGERIRGGFNAVTLRAPNLGGAFAVWGGLFATFDCTYAHLRSRDDSWNAIMSGATTGGILAARAGWRAAGRSAIVGGVLLGMIEGMGVMLEKLFKEEQPQQTMMAPPSTQSAKASSVAPSPPAAQMPLGLELASDASMEDYDFEDAGNQLGADILDDPWDDDYDE